MVGKDREGATVYADWEIGLLRHACQIWQILQSRSFAMLREILHSIVVGFLRVVWWACHRLACLSCVDWLVK